MLLADSNFWLSLALSKHAFHPAVRAWFARRKPPETVLFCRSTQQSFLRLLTTSAVLAPYGIPPLSNKAAWSTYDGFRADKRIAWVDEPPGLASHWKKLAGGAKPSPKLWMDAYLAAFALAGGYQIVTTDKAFKQFKRLDLIVLPNGWNGH
jgi:toxin-antitoxin system PIN domain toxin